MNYPHRDYFSVVSLADILAISSNMYLYKQIGIIKSLHNLELPVLFIPPAIKIHHLSILSSKMEKDISSVCRGILDSFKSLLEK